MAKCVECGRQLDAFNAVRFTERECIGVGYTGKREYQTSSFTVCSVCAEFVEWGIAIGRVKAQVASKRKGDV